MLLEPPKNSWDIVFTRARDTIYAANVNASIPYFVTAILLNSYNTEAAPDSTSDFATIELGQALAMSYTRERPIIGYDWKIYNFTTGRYEVNRRKNYILHNRNDHYYKLRFLDFYNSSGQKGAPIFEYQRLK